MRNFSHSKVGAMFWGTLVIAFVSIMALFPNTYVDKDKNGEKIDCLSLLKDSKNGDGFSNIASVFPHKAYVRDREIETGYQFKQCRAEIDREHKERCKEYIHAEFESTTLNYFSPYSDMGNDAERCSTEAQEYALALADDYEIQGNALLAKGMVFHKSGLTVGAVGIHHGGHAVYYVVPIGRNDEKIYLRFGSEAQARKVHEKMTQFLVN
ncbi:hypothetical protein ACVP6W_003156 [Vibrio cholerae]